MAEEITRKPLRVSSQTQKCDTTANWDRAVNFIPKKGEIIFYQDTLDGITMPTKQKVGDGKTRLAA